MLLINRVITEVKLQIKPENFLGSTSHFSAFLVAVNSTVLIIQKTVNNE